MGSFIQSLNLVLKFNAPDLRHKMRVRLRPTQVLAMRNAYIQFSGLKRYERNSTRSFADPDTHHRQLWLSAYHSIHLPNNHSLEVSGIVSHTFDSAIKDVLLEYAELPVVHTVFRCKARVCSHSHGSDTGLADASSTQDEVSKLRRK